MSGARRGCANVVVDRGVQIPEGLVVGEDPDLDARVSAAPIKGSA